jgi:cell division protein FtsN
MKNKQRQATKETEKLLNERLEEFKDELGAAQKVELEKQKESLKKDIQEEGMKLQQSGDNRNDMRNNANMNSNQSEWNSNQSEWNSNQSEWNSNRSSSQDEGIISGYRNENYANNVKPGSSGYYVTAGVYGESRNANRMASKLKSRGIQANVFRDSRNNMFYVYLLKFPSYYEADAARTSGLRGQYSGKLWIKVVK